MSEKKKVLLCAIHSQYVHSSPAVYALQAALTRYAPAEAFTVEIAEHTINDTDAHILYHLLREKPDILGFSVYIWNVAVITRLCRSIKAVYPDVRIILGGPEVSYGIGHTALRETDYDLIVSGEGELAFTAAVCLLADIKLSASLGAKKNGKVITAPPVAELASLPPVYTEENIHRFQDRIVYYESSRGCPFSCAYCLSSVCGKVRSLPPARVFEDLDFFIRHDVPQVKFVDRTFNCQKERAAKIWEYILRRSGDSRTNFHFEIGADLLDETGLAILRQMPRGKVQLEIGIQSTNAQALRACCRYAPTEVIARNVTALAAGGNVHLHTDLIAGLPYEDFRSFAQSFNDVYALGAQQVQLGFLKLLPGAPLNDLIEKHGYVFTADPPYEILKNKYLSFAELQRLKEIEDALEKFYNSGRFALSLHRLEQHFPTPFAMYEALADAMKAKGLLFASVSTRKLYDFLFGFAEAHGAPLAELLLEDFYVSEKSLQLPESLRYLLPLHKDAQPAANQFLRENGFARENAVMARFIGGTALAIHYGKKDPVTGRFPVLLRKEGVLYDV